MGNTYNHFSLPVYFTHFFASMVTAGTFCHISLSVLNYERIRAVKISKLISSVFVQPTTFPSCSTLTYLPSFLFCLNTRNRHSAVINSTAPSKISHLCEMNDFFRAFFCTFSTSCTFFIIYYRYIIVHYYGAVFTLFHT